MKSYFKDFTYGNDYFETWVLQGAGGAALESHDFSHLDCPLTPMKKSGYFVLAKWMNDARTDIEITAFQVMDIGGLGADYIKYNFDTFLKHLFTSYSS